MIADFRDAFRQWRRSPLVTAVALVSLTLGIGVNLALFSIVDTVLLKTLPIPRAQELVRIVTTDFRPGEQHEIAVPTHVWQYIRDHQRLFASVTGIATDRVNIARGGEARYAGCAYVDAGYFETLGLPMVRGRGFTASDDHAGGANVAIISSSLWQREYGAREVIGQPIYLDGHRFTIVGVGPSDFFGLQVGRVDDVMLPMAAQDIVRGAKSQVRAADAAWVQIYARLRHPDDFDTARAALRAWFPIVREATASPAVPAERHLPYAFDLVRAAQGYSLLRQQYRTPLTVLLAAVGIVLLIACTNLAMLATARVADRQHEIGIRLSLGASRWRVTRLVMTDAFAMALTASAVGVWGGHALASSLTPLLTFAQGPTLTTRLALALDGRLIAAAVCLVVAATAVAAFLPAVRSTRVSLLASLSLHVRGSGSRGTLRMMRGLSTAQVALSVALVVGAVLLIRSFRVLTTQPTGVDGAHVLVASVNDPFQSGRSDEYLRRIERTRGALQTVPGVTAVSAGLVTPMSGLMAGAALHVPGSMAIRPTGAFNYVLPDYFAVLGTPLLIGREFEWRDVQAGPGGRPDVAIVNKAFANHHFGGFNPIGRVLIIGGRPLHIIGVVANTRAMSLREDGDVPMAYGAMAQRSNLQSANVRWVVRAENLDTVKPGIIGALRIVDPRISIELSTIAEDAIRGVGRERLLARIASLFAALGLLITGVGVYGTFSYAVVRRQAEIGVRMALGATRRDILRLVAKEAGLLMSAGMIAGVIIAIASRRWLQSLLFGISATELTSYLVALAGIGIAIAGATYLPARRASSLAPADALRE